MQPSLILIPMMILSLVITKLIHTYASPVLSIINRWLRWFVLAGGFAEISLYFDWFQQSFKTLFAAFFIGWFLIDSIYRWLTISAISVSPLPLFPRFKLNPSGDQWPVQGRFLKLRDTLREKGFNHLQALRSEVSTHFQLRVSVYQKADSHLRLQVSFLPHPGGNLSLCFQFTTRLVDGTCLVTDNHFLPFAGFYSENWLVQRKPNTRSFLQLLNYHERRVTLSGKQSVAWDTEPVVDLNAQQAELERINTEMGFLLPHNLHDEHGRISYEGRYRIWKEMLTLNYFGKPAVYH